MTSTARPLAVMSHIGRRRPRTVGAIPCRECDPELWFAERPEQVELAKALCGVCPLQGECLAGALERGEPWGVWGGQLVVDGGIVAHKRPRGRPRKDTAA
jgi:WhiB family redox-sensing transcriptional regulator